MGTGWTMCVADAYADGCKLGCDRALLALVLYGTPGWKWRVGASGGLSLWPTMWVLSALSIAIRPHYRDRLGRNHQQAVPDVEGITLGKKRRFHHPSGKKKNLRCAQLQWPSRSRECRQPRLTASRRWGPLTLSRTWKLSRAMASCAWYWRWTLSKGLAVAARTSGLLAGALCWTC